MGVVRFVLSPFAKTALVTLSIQSNLYHHHHHHHHHLSKANQQTNQDDQDSHQHPPAFVAFPARRWQCGVAYGRKL
jgi:superoxide dismutase